MSVRVLNNEKQELGEGPHWIASNQTVLIVDIDRQCVKFIDFVSGNTLETHEFNDKVGAAIPYADDPNFIVVAKGNRLIKYDIVKRIETEVLCDVSEHEKGVKMRINDSKCDPYGRILFGTMPIEFPDGILPPNAGKLYSYSKGELKVLVDGVSLSNGLAWSRDNATMFYIDSLPNRSLSAFDYDEEGNISNRRILVDFTAEGWNEHGIPDGMTIDVQDNLWVATFTGGSVLNIDSRTGKLLNKIKVPSMNTTSACFGGPDLSTLIVTAAGSHAIPQGVVEEQGGMTFALSDLGTKGRFPVNFAG